MPVFKSNANATVQQLVNLPNVISEKKALIRSIDDGDKYQFSSKLQIMITKVTAIIEKIIISPRPTYDISYFKNALQYLCWNVVSCKELWGIFEDAEINKSANKQKHTIEVDVTKIDIARFRKQYNRLIDLLIQASHINSFGNLKIPVTQQKPNNQSNPNNKPANPKVTVGDPVGTLTVALRPGKGIINSAFGKKKLNCFFDFKFSPKDPKYRICKVEAIAGDGEVLNVREGTNELKIPIDRIKRPLSIKITVKVRLGGLLSDTKDLKCTVSMNY